MAEKRRSNTKPARTALRQIRISDDTVAEAEETSDMWAPCAYYIGWWTAQAGCVRSLITKFILEI